MVSETRSNLKEILTFDCMMAVFTHKLLLTWYLRFAVVAVYCLMAAHDFRLPMEAAGITALFFEFVSEHPLSHLIVPEVLDMGLARKPV